MSETQYDWAPVSWEDLNDGDQVILTDKSGEEYIRGVVAGDKVVIRLGEYKISFLSEDTDYDVSRGTPQWTAPTEPGLYIREGGDPSRDPVFLLSPGGLWASDERTGKDTGPWSMIYDNTDLLPRDLIRLVPDFEAADLQRRIDRVWDYVESLDIDAPVTQTRRREILDLLNGRVPKE